MLLTPKCLTPRFPVVGGIAFFTPSSVASRVTSLLPIEVNRFFPQSGQEQIEKTNQNW
jgi:hypothetical protein